MAATASETLHATIFNSAWQHLQSQWADIQSYWHMLQRKAPNTVAGEITALQGEFAHFAQNWKSMAPAALVDGLHRVTTMLETELARLKTAITEADQAATAPADKPS